MNEPWVERERLLTARQDVDVPLKVERQALAAIADEVHACDEFLASLQKAWPQQPGWAERRAADAMLGMVYRVRGLADHLRLRFNAAR